MGPYLLFKCDKTIQSSVNILYYPISVSLTEAPSNILRYPDKKILKSSKLKADFISEASVKLGVSFPR